VLSLGDAAMVVTVGGKDADSGDVTQITTLTLQTLDSDTEPIPAGTYVLTFQSAAAGARQLTCTIDVKDRDSYRFVTTDATAVTRNLQTPANAAEQLVATSSLCGS
jgi:hypothetical protein